MNPSTSTPQKNAGTSASVSGGTAATGPSASLVNAHQFALAQLHQAAQLRTSPPHHPIHPSAWSGETVDEGHFASIIHEQSVLISKLLHEKKIIAEENTRNRRAMRGIDERVEAIITALGLNGKVPLSSSDDAAAIEAESASVDPLTLPSLTPHAIDSAHMVQLTEDNVRLIQEMQSLTAILGYFYGQTEEAISMAGEALTHANEATGEEEELTVAPVLNQTLSDIQQLLSQLSISLLHANDPDAVAASAQASAEGRSLASFQPFASSVALPVPIQAVIQHYKQLQPVKDIMALNQTQSGDINQSFSLATTAPLPSLTTSSSSSASSQSGPLSPARNMSAAARQVPLGVSAGLLGPQSVSADESTLALQNQIQALQNQLLKLANENQELKSLAAASDSLKSRRQSRGSNPDSSDDDESFTDAVSKFFAPLAGGSNRGGQVKSNQSTPAHSRVTTRDDEGFMEQRSPIRPLQLQPNSFVLPSTVVGGGMNPEKAEEFVKTNVEIWNQKEMAYIEQEKKLLVRIEQLKSDYRSEIESLKAKSATPAVEPLPPVDVNAPESSLAMTLASLQAAHASLSELQSSTESRRLAANERAHSLAAEKARLVQEKNQTIDQLTRENERLQTMYETLETESRNSYYTLQKAYRELEAKYNMLASSVEKEREKLAKKKLNETKEKEAARKAALLKFRADTTAAPSASFFRSLNASGLNTGVSSATGTPPLSSPNSANAIQRQRSLQKAFAAAQKRQDSMMGRMRSRSSERVEPTTPSSDAKGLRTAFGAGGNNNTNGDDESDNEFSGSQSVPQTSPSSPRWTKKDHPSQQHGGEEEEEEKQQVVQSPGGTEFSQEEYEHQVRAMAEQQYHSELAHFQAVETAKAMEEAKVTEEYLRAEQMHQQHLQLIQQQAQIQAQQLQLQQQQEQLQAQQQMQQPQQQQFEQFASSPEQAAQQSPDESHATPSFTGGIAFNSSFLSEKTNASPVTTANLKISTSSNATPGRKTAPLSSPSASNGLRQQLLVPFNSSIVGSPSSHSHSSTGSHTTGLSASPTSSSSLSLVPTTKRLASTTSTTSGASGAPGLARKKTAATSALTAALNRANSTAASVSGESVSSSPPAPMLTRLKSQSYAAAPPMLTKEDRNAKSSYMMTGSFLSQPLNPSFHEEYAMPASYIKMHGSHSTSALAHMHQGKYVLVDASKRTGYLHHKSDLPVAVAQRNQTLVGMSVKTDSQSPLPGGQQQMLLGSSPTVAYESGGHGSGPQSSGALVAAGSPTMPDGAPALQRAASSLNTQTTVPLHHALFPDARTRPLIRQNTVLASHQKQANANEKWFVLGGSHGADGFRALPPKIDARWDVNSTAAQQHMPEQQLLQSLQQQQQTLQVTDLPIGSSTALTSVNAAASSSPQASPVKSPSSARPISSPASKSNKKTQQQKRPDSASASPPAVASASKAASAAAGASGRPGLNASRKGTDTTVHEFSQWDDEEENHHVGLISVKAE